MPTLSQPEPTVTDLVGQEPSESGDRFVRRIPASWQGEGGPISDADLPTEYAEGVLDLAEDGHGYLRPKFIPSEKDIYISSSQVRKFQLRVGDVVGGQVRPPKENERYFGLLKVEKVNGILIEKLAPRPYFEDLLPIFPQPQVILETEKSILSTRMVDLVSPIGFGQRGLIVSPPKAGKTWLLKDIAAGVARNYPEAGSKKLEAGKETRSSKLEKSSLKSPASSQASSFKHQVSSIHLMAVLIGERPEEVTDIRRHIEKATGGKGETISSNFDEPPEWQTRAAEIALERAKRVVELGYDVFILLDSITRLARAYNLSIPTSGRTLTGGFDPAALHPAKHFFGAARKMEKQGSLTIIGTCLIDTGSRMDDLIYEEFKGTGNMELHLVRKLAERRVFPAFDIQRSGTRHEELLFAKKTYEKIVVMRKMIDLLNLDERTEVFIERLKKTKTNKEFLETLNKR